MSFTDTRQASTFRAPQTLQARQLPAGVLLEVMAILFEHRETSESILSLWEELGKPKHEGRLEYYIPLLPALWRAVPYDDHWRWLDRYKLLQAAKRLIEIRLPDWNACTSLSTGGRKQDSKFRSHSPENSAILSKVEGLELDDPTAKWISMNDRTNRKHQWLEDVISKDGALRLLYGQNFSNYRSELEQLDYGAKNLVGSDVYDRDSVVLAVRWLLLLRCWQQGKNARYLHFKFKAYQKSSGRPETTPTEAEGSSCVTQLSSRDCVTSTEDSRSILEEVANSSANLVPQSAKKTEDLSQGSSFTGRVFYADRPKGSTTLNRDERRKAARVEIERIGDEVELLRAVFLKDHQTNFQFFLDLRRHLEAGAVLPNFVNFKPKPWKCRQNLYMEMTRSLILEDAPDVNDLYTLVAKLIYLRYEQMAGQNIKSFKDHFDLAEKYHIFSLQQSEDVPRIATSGREDQSQDGPSTRPSDGSEWQTYNPRTETQASSEVSAAASALPSNTINSVYLHRLENPARIPEPA